MIRSIHFERVDKDRSWPGVAGLLTHFAGHIRRSHKTAPEPEHQVPANETAAAGNTDSESANRMDSDRYHPYDPSVMRQWQEMLSSTAEQLMQLSHSTESEFLSLGDRLAQINSMNRQNATMVRTISEEVVDNRMADLESLEELLVTAFEKADAAETLLQQLSDELSLTLGNIDEIIQLNDLLNRTYRSLRMIRVMIRIETENAGAIDFHTVADALASLEQLISRNTDQISTAAQETGELINRVRDHFNTDLENRKKPLRTDRTRINDLIETIRSKLLEISLTCGQMCDYTQSISSEIGKVVTYLQFHDNYRQRLEHISHNLSEMASRIGSPDPSSGSLKAWLIAVIGLQIAQIVNLKQESHDVSTCLTDSFHSIRALMQEQLQSAEHAMPVLSEQEEHVTRLDDVLRSFCSDMDAYLEADAELLVSVDQLGEMISGITSISDLIEANELSLRLLALNSIIKAFAMGRHGKPLAVLSKEINTISGTVQAQIADRSGIITAIHDSADTITSELLVNLRTSTTTANSTLDNTGEGIRKLLEKDDRLENCSELSQRLQNDFADLMNQFSFSRTVDISLSEAMTQLENILNQITATLPDSPEEAKLSDSELQALKKRYTMQSERDIHQAAIDSDVQTSRFDNATPDDSDFSDDSGSLDDGDLGDNIELF